MYSRHYDQGQFACVEELPVPVTVSPKFSKLCQLMPIMLAYIILKCLHIPIMLKVMQHNLPTLRLVIIQLLVDVSPLCVLFVQHAYAIVIKLFLTSVCVSVVKCVSYLVCALILLTY